MPSINATSISDAVHHEAKKFHEDDAERVFLTNDTEGLTETRIPNQLYPDRIVMFLRTRHLDDHRRDQLILQVI